MLQPRLLLKESSSSVPMQTATAMKITMTVTAVMTIAEITTQKTITAGVTDRWIFCLIFF
jgi:hypothetical protein